MKTTQYALFAMMCIFLIFDFSYALESGSRPLKNTQEKLAQKLVQDIEGKGATYTTQMIAKLEKTKIKNNSKIADIYNRALYLLKKKSVVNKKLNNSIKNKKNPRVPSNFDKSKNPQPKIDGVEINTPIVSSNTLLATTGSVVTLNYTLHTDSETGPLQETTLQSVAQANGLYKIGANYQPFQVALGQNQVIYGFEKGLMGVKKGQKKMIKVIPSEGYGRPVPLTRDQIAPSYTLVRDRKSFDNTTRQTIKKTDFPFEMQEKINTAKVGDIILGAQNQPAKVVEITTDTITMDIENTMSPFYKKELIVGVTASTPDADIKITAIDAMNNVTLSVTNKKSPFYNKKFAVGESVTPQNGAKITVKEINKENNTVSILADHPFMNKLLFFDVEIVDIQ